MSEILLNKFYYESSVFLPENLLSLDAAILFISMLTFISAFVIYIRMKEVPTLSTNISAAN